jgi:spermidine synthase
MKKQENSNKDGKLFILIFSIIVFLSGIAGLSYELIWIRSIKGYFGSEIYSVAMVIAIYFAGLGLGGIIASYYLRKKISPLLLYSFAEFLLAIISILFPYLLILIYKLYLILSTLFSPDVWILVKGFLITILLLTPTTLIGLTLPLIAAAIVPRADLFTSKFSRFYGLNTFGAVTGCLLCGILFIPNFGLIWSGRIIAVINMVVSGLTFWCDKNIYSAEYSIIYKTQKWNKAIFPGFIAFLMGMLALIYEIVWIRIFGFYFITSSISLALLLSIFLIGLALGSAILSLWKKPVTLVQLALLELFKAIVMIVCFLLVRKIFYQEWDSIILNFTINNGFEYLTKYQIIFGLMVFLMPSILMGMSFPLIERIWPSAKAGTGHVVGIVTAWNTWGGAIGSAITGLILIVLIGTINTLLISIFMAIALSIILFLYTKKYLYLTFDIIIIAAILLFFPDEINYKRSPENLPAYEYYREGKECSISVLKNEFGEKSLYINNTYVLGGTNTRGLLVQRRQGTLPNLLSPSRSKNVLKIGLGTGVTLSSMANSNKVKNVTAVEIIPEVLDVLNLFSYYNNNIKEKDNVQLYKGDGREFLTLSDQKFDVIVGELYTPQFAGVGNLYSIEHLKNIKKHLASGGIFCQWLQLTQFSPETFAIVVRTFLEVFKKGSLWLANFNLEIPTVGLIACPENFYDIQEIEEGIKQYKMKDLKKIGWKEPLDIGLQFITNDLSELFPHENRINSINNPWVEEISARVISNTQPPLIKYLIDHRKWPEAWQEWDDGYHAWVRFGEVLNIIYTIFIQKQIHYNSYNKLIAMMDSLPQSSAFNILKADILVTIIEDILLQKRIFKDERLQYLYALELLKEAVHLVPENYIYRYNLIYLYQILNQRNNMIKEIIAMWNVLPDHLKKEEIYRNLITMTD